MTSIPNKFINFAPNANVNIKDLWQISIGLKLCWRKRNAPTRSWRRYWVKTLLPFQSGVPTTHNPTCTHFRRLQQFLMLTSVTSSIIQNKDVT